MNESKTAALLVSLRKSKGMTQADLAALLDVTYQAVSKWERGENLPDAYTLIDLAKIYNISVDEILKGKLNKIVDIDTLRKKKMMIFIIALSFLILSPISIFILGYDKWTIYVPIILVIATISVGLIIYAFAVPTKGPYSSESIDPRQKRLEEVIYSIAAGIFLILGLLFNLFHVAWIIFIFAYALTRLMEKD